MIRGNKLVPSLFRFGKKCVTFFEASARRDILPKPKWSLIFVEPRGDGDGKIFNRFKKYWKLRNLYLHEKIFGANFLKLFERKNRKCHEKCSSRKIIENHMGGRKIRNFEKLIFSIFKVKMFRYFHFSKIFFANVDFENRKFLFFYKKKVAGNIFM